MIDTIIHNLPVTLSEAVAFINVLSDKDIYRLANKLREHFNGEKFSTCMIMNAKSGNCTENCKWCAQSAQYQTNSPQFPLASIEEISKQASLASTAKVHRYALVNSGRKPSPNEVSELETIFSLLKQSHPNLKYCASLGLCTKQELETLYKAGVQRYHCNIETAPSHFPHLCTSHTLEDKTNTIRAAQEVGMTICSGGIIGMGETEEQRIEMALYLRSLQVDSIPINILLPIKGTALENQPSLSNREILRAFALFKIFNPKASIRFAAGRAKVKEIQDQALQCGVSASIVGDMLTTIGSSLKEDMKYFSSKRTLI